MSLLKMPSSLQNSMATLGAASLLVANAGVKANAADANPVDLRGEVATVLGDNTVSPVQMAQSTSEYINALNKKANNAKLRELAQLVRAQQPKDATNVFHVEQNKQQVELNPDYIFNEMKKQCPQYVNEGTKACIEAAWMQHPEIKNKIVSRVQNLKEDEKIDWGLLAVWLDTSNIFNHPENSYSNFVWTEKYCTSELNTVVIDQSKIGNGEEVRIPFSLNNIRLVPINMKPLPKGKSFSCTIVGGSYSYNFSVDNSSDGTVTVDGARIAFSRDDNGTLIFSNNGGLKYGDEVGYSDFDGRRKVEMCVVGENFELENWKKYLGWGYSYFYIDKSEASTDSTIPIICKVLERSKEELPDSWDQVSDAKKNKIKAIIKKYFLGEGEEIAYVFLTDGKIRIRTSSQKDIFIPVLNTSAEKLAGIKVKENRTLTDLEEVKPEDFVIGELPEGVEIKDSNLPKELGANKGSITFTDGKKTCTFEVTYTVEKSQETLDNEEMKKVSVKEIVVTDRDNIDVKKFFENLPAEATISDAEFPMGIGKHEVEVTVTYNTVAQKYTLKYTVNESEETIANKEKQEGKNIVNNAQPSLTFINTITPQTDTSAIIKHKKLLVEYCGQLFPISEKYGNCFSVEIGKMNAGIKKADDALENVRDEDLAYLSFEGDEKNFEPVWNTGDKGQIFAYLKTLDGSKKEADKVNVNGIYDTAKRNKLLQSYNTIKKTVVDYVNSIKPIINPAEINEQNFGKYEKQVSDFYLWVSNLPEEFRLDLGDYSDVEKISEKIQLCKANKTKMENELPTLENSIKELLKKPVPTSGVYADTVFLARDTSNLFHDYQTYQKYTEKLGKQNTYETQVGIWIKSYRNKIIEIKGEDGLVDGCYETIKKDWQNMNLGELRLYSSELEGAKLLLPDSGNAYNAETIAIYKKMIDDKLKEVNDKISELQKQYDEEQLSQLRCQDFTNAIAGWVDPQGQPLDATKVSFAQVQYGLGFYKTLTDGDKAKVRESLDRFVDGSKSLITESILGLKNFSETGLGELKTAEECQGMNSSDIKKVLDAYTSALNSVGDDYQRLKDLIAEAEKIVTLLEKVSEVVEEIGNLRKAIDSAKEKLNALGGTKTTLDKDEKDVNVLYDQVKTKEQQQALQEQQQQMEGQFTTSLTTLQGYLGEDITTKSKVDLLTLSANISSEKETLSGLAKTLNRNITDIVDTADQKIEDIKKQIASVETEEERRDWINAFIGVLSKFTNDANTGGTIAQMSKSKSGLDSVITIASDSILVWNWEKRIEDAIDGDPTFSFAIALGGAKSKSVDLKNSIADTKKAYDDCKNIYDPLADKKYDPTIAGGKEADEARNDAKTKVDNPNDFTKDKFESAGKDLKQKNADYDANKQSVDDAANAQKKVDQVNALEPNLGKNPLKWGEDLKSWNDAYSKLSDPEKLKVTNAKHFIGANEISGRWTSLSNDIQKSGEDPEEGLSYGDDGKWYLNKQTAIASQNQCTGSFEYVLQNTILSVKYSEYSEEFGDLQAEVAQRSVADMIKQLSADSVYNTYMDSIPWFNALGTQYEALKKEVGYNPETSSVTCDKLDILKKVVEDLNDLEHDYGESFLGLQEFMNSEKFASLVDDKKEKLQELYDQLEVYFGSGDSTKGDGCIRQLAEVCESKIQEIENSESTPVSEVTPENNANMFYDGESIYVPNVKQGEIIRIFTVAGQYLGSHKVPTDGIFKVPFHNNILPYPIVVVKVGDQKGVKVRVK